MAKHDQDQDAPEAADQQPPQPQPPGEGTLYRITTWRDLPNYVCTRCEFASLHPADIQAHNERRHQEGAV